MNDIASLSDGTFTNEAGGLVSDLTQSGGTFTNQANAELTAAELSGAANLANAGDAGTIAMTNGTLSNQAGGTLDALDQDGGSTTNAGAITAVTQNGGDVTNQNGGSIADAILNDGTLENEVGGAITDLEQNGGTLVNDGTIASVDQSAGDATNNGTVSGTVDVGGTFTNTNGATIGGDVTVTGVFENLDGAVVQGLTTNDGGTIGLFGGEFLQDVVGDGTFLAQVDFNRSFTLNQGSTFIVIDDFAFTSPNNDFTNNGDLVVSGGDFTGIGALQNNAAGTIDVAVGNELESETLGNAGQLNVDVGGTVDVAGALINSGTSQIDGTVAAGALGNSGQLNVADGGAVDVANTLTNNGAAQIDGTLDAGALVNNDQLNLATTGTADIAGVFRNNGVSQIDGTLDAGSMRNNDTLVVAGDLTSAGAVTNAANGTTVIDGGTLTAASFNNLGTLEFEDVASTFDADLTNQAGAIARFGSVSGQTVDFANSAITNSGLVEILDTVTLANVSTFTLASDGVLDLTANDAGTGERLTIGGTLAGSDQVIQMDVNLDDRDDPTTNDLLIVNGVSGALTFDLTDNSGDVNAEGFTAEALLESQSNIAAGSDAFSVTGLGDQGLFDYSADVAGSSIILNRELRVDLLGGIVTNFVATQEAISQAFFKPASGFVSSPIDPEPNQFGYAPFFRANGGFVRVGSEGIGVFENEPTVIDSEVNVGFAGYQAGIDGAIFNIMDKGIEAHVGLTAGQVFGFAEQSEISNETTSQTTFIGLYGVASRGPLFADIQLRQEFTTFDVAINDVRFPITGLEVDADRFSANVSGGYAFTIKDYIVVPSAGYTYARTSTDDVDLVGTLGTQTVGRVSFGDVESHIVFGGITVGRTFPLFDEKVLATPFATLTAYHDLGADAEAALVFGQHFSSLDQRIDTVSNRDDTYGELSFGARFTTLSPEIAGEQRLISGNARADIQFGKNKLGGALDLQFRVQF